MLKHHYIRQILILQSEHYQEDPKDKEDHRADRHTITLSH